MTKQLSKTARLRLVRQSVKRIQALTQRLITCDMREFEQVQKELFAEREALTQQENQ